MLVWEGLFEGEQHQAHAGHQPDESVLGVRGGQPGDHVERMNVFFSNGDVAFLDSSVCNKPIASSGGTWLRSDFTGFKTGCSFSVVGDTAGTYAADGTHSAWAVYAACSRSRW